MMPCQGDLEDFFPPAGKCKKTLGPGTALPILRVVLTRKGHK